MLRTRAFTIGIVAAGALAVAIAGGLSVAHHRTPESATHVVQATRMFDADVTWGSVSGSTPRVYQHVTLAHPGVHFTADSASIDRVGHIIDATQVDAVINAATMHADTLHAISGTSMTGGWSIDLQHVSMPLLAGTLTASAANVSLDAKGHLVRVHLDHPSISLPADGRSNLVLVAQDAVVLLDPQKQVSQVDSSGAPSTPPSLDTALVDAMLVSPSISGAALSGPVMGDYAHIQFHPASAGGVGSADISVTGASLNGDAWPVLAALHVNGTVPLVLQGHVDRIQHTLEIDMASNLLGNGGAVVRFDAPVQLAKVFANTQPVSGLSMTWKDLGLVARWVQSRAYADNMAIDAEQVVLAAEIRDHSMISGEILSADDVRRFLQGSATGQAQLAFTPAAGLVELGSSFWSQRPGISGQVLFGNSGP